MRQNEHPTDVAKTQDGRHPQHVDPAFTDADSKAHLAEEVLEPPHEASRFDAGTGQGTAHPPKHVAFQERPILDGSTQNPLTEATVPNPSRGLEDPARVTQQPALNTTKTDRWLFSSMVAVTIVTVTLLLLMRWNPLWCGIGVAFALVGVLAMLGIRASRAGRHTRLWSEAVLLWLVWLVPLVIIVSVLVTSADEIWGS